jgi:hypothetical protein
MAERDPGILAVQPRKFNSIASERHKWALRDSGALAASIGYAGLPAHRRSARNHDER